MLARVSLATVAAGLALAGGSAQEARAGGGLGGAHPCPGTAGFTCGTLTVPLDHSGRRAGTLRLAVAAGSDAKAPRGVLLLLTGGPGQPGVPALSRLPAIVGAELHDYRVVVFDQRGTGAGALDCPALQAAMGSSDLFPAPAAAVRQCAAKVGSRRQYYGTDDVVADIELLREALGARKIAVDGISYGTYVGERYALAHPEHVSKLVLDSVVPHEGLFDLGTAEFAGVRRVLGKVCGAACVADLAAVVKRHGHGAELLDALTFDSIVDPTYVTSFDVPGILRDARAGRTGPLTQWLENVHRWSATAASELDQGLHASALCADWRYPWGTAAAPLRGRAAAVGRAVAKLSAKALYPFDRATVTAGGFISQCLPWTPTPPTPGVPRGAKLRVPTLLVNGDHDLSTPLEWARRELELAPRGTLVIVPGAGHSVQSRAVSAVGRRAVARFLLG